MKLKSSEKAAFYWLFRAQDTTPERGISKYYLIGGDWLKENYKKVSGSIWDVVDYAKEDSNISFNDFVEANKEGFKNKK